MAFRIHISGDYACFRRSEFVVDLISYDVMTPAAARAIFESVHWTPSIEWIIDEIRVLKPIRKRWIECSPEYLHPSPSTSGLDPNISRSNVLIDAAYLVIGHFNLTTLAGASESAAQHGAMFRRRLARHQFFRPPFLGIRVFPATVSEIAKGSEPLGAPELAGVIDLGWMLYDICYREDKRPRFYRPIMTDGIIDLRRPDALILAG